MRALRAFALGMLTLLGTSWTSARAGYSSVGVNLGWPGYYRPWGYYPYYPYYYSPYQVYVAPAPVVVQPPPAVQAVPVAQPSCIAAPVPVVARSAIPNDA